MKKCSICLCLFFTVIVVGTLIGYSTAVNQKHSDSASTRQEYVETTEAVEQKAANQELVRHEIQSADAYYLVSENGFLMVFPDAQTEACLYTHIPLMEMPVSEQDRLREGIWFPSMSELFQYLESCTS